MFKVEIDKINTLKSRIEEVKNEFEDTKSVLNDLLQSAVSEAWEGDSADAYKDFGSKYVSGDLTSYIELLTNTASALGNLYEQLNEAVITTNKMNNSFGEIQYSSARSENETVLYSNDAFDAMMKAHNQIEYINEEEVRMMKDICSRMGELENSHGINEAVDLQRKFSQMGNCYEEYGYFAKEYQDRMANIKAYIEEAFDSRSEDFVGKNSVFSTDFYSNILKLDYLNSLPDIFRPLISLNDLRITDDGFIMCIKSVGKLLEELGIDNYFQNEAGEYVSTQMLEAWYFFAIKGEDGNFYDSLYKVRTIDEQYPGVSVSFQDFDLDKLKELILSHDDNNPNSDIFNFINALTTSSEKLETSIEIAKYFARTESDGSYLIGEFAIEKMAELINNNEIVINDTLRVYQSKEIYEYLYEGGMYYDGNGYFANGSVYERGKLFALLDAGIYTKEYTLVNGDTMKTPLDDTVYKNMVIESMNFKDANNLTKLEKDALLLLVSANQDLNSLAAEVQYHALATLHYQGIKVDGIDLSGIEKFVLDNRDAEISSVKSDHGHGEAGTLGGKVAENFFKSYISDLYKEQSKAHPLED